MRARFAFFMSALISLVGLLPASAENPSREKCTCDVDPDSEPNNGAWVQNATSCWSTEVTERQWCDIVVQSLEGGEAQQSIVLDMLARPSDSAAITATMQERFNAFVATAERTGTPLDLGRARAAVPGLLVENAQAIQQCLVATGDGKRGMLIEGVGGLRCGVGESSGWLRVEFPVGEVKLVYLVAPPR